MITFNVVFNTSLVRVMSHVVYRVTIYWADSGNRLNFLNPKVVYCLEKCYCGNVNSARTRKLILCPSDVMKRQSCPIITAGR